MEESDSSYGVTDTTCETEVSVEALFGFFLGPSVVNFSNLADLATIS